MVAIDFAADVCPPHPEVFDTAELLSRTPLWHSVEVSAKRNTGIVLAHLVGWERVFFLDDDVRIDDPGHIQTASDLLDGYAVSGLAVHGFPDLSVVGHACKRVGQIPDSFLAGGVLMTAPKRRPAFFPEIYNDDWLYLLDDDSFPRLALTGSAVHAEYQPFDDPKKAAHQEFGEVIAQGLHSGIRHGIAPGHADRTFWRSFLSAKYNFLHELLEKLEERNPHGQNDVAAHAAVQEAITAHDEINPALCIAYTDAWKRDRHWWTTYLAQLPSTMTLPDAITQLGLHTLMLLPGPTPATNC
ncbi:hypothetical protein [Nocardia wallacei]|uniref:hypothetical protein n=1 Tax=Nocardia wallacei TaxID=480035 RepID=UPI002457AB8F|nr:hypothetical protein [Nocardia wallacei]